MESEVHEQQAAEEFPPPESLSWEQRVGYLQTLRQRILDKGQDSVSEDEVRYGVRLIRLNRAESSSRSTKGRVPKVEVSDAGRSLLGMLGQQKG